MNINAGIKNYNYRFAEDRAPYKSRMNFYKKIIWIWSFIPVWYFANIIFVLILFSIVYLITCALISLFIFLTTKYRR